MHATARSWKRRTRAHTCSVGSTDRAAPLPQVPIPELADLRGHSFSAFDVQLLPGQPLVVPGPDEAAAGGAQGISGDHVDIELVIRWDTGCGVWRQA